MPQDVQIEPVPRRSTVEALRFLAGGLRRGVSAELRVEAFERMIKRSRRGWVLRWACREGRPVGAALVVASAGGAGMAYHCPAGAPGVDVSAAAAALRSASLAALDGDLPFVQSLLAPRAREDVALLRSAGYRHLAELVYMRLEVGKAAGEEGIEGLAWRRVEQAGEAELCEIIHDTYADSKDCPGLYGLRGMADVIAGHKASGSFRPDWWWLAYVSQRRAACVLVNDSTVSAGDAELVYMGVVPAMRGRRLGRAMVRRAAACARQARRGAINVAVDSANGYAKNIYDEEGFRETTRRAAYIITPEAPREAPKLRSCE